MGAHPSLEVVAKEELVTVLDHANGTRDEKISEDPLQIPVELSEDWRPATVDGLPNCFCGERKHERSLSFVCLVQSIRVREFTGALNCCCGIPLKEFGFCCPTQESTASKPSLLDKSSGKPESPSDSPSTASSGHSSQ